MAYKVGWLEPINYMKYILCGGCGNTLYVYRRNMFVGSSRPGHVAVSSAEVRKQMLTGRGKSPPSHYSYLHTPPSTVLTLDDRNRQSRHSILIIHSMYVPMCFCSHKSWRHRHLMCDVRCLERIDYFSLNLQSLIGINNTNKKVYNAYVLNNNCGKVVSL